MSRNSLRFQASFCVFFIFAVSPSSTFLFYPSLDARRDCSFPSLEGTCGRAAARSCASQGHRRSASLFRCAPHGKVAEVSAPAADALPEPHREESPALAVKAAGQSDNNLTETVVRRATVEELMICYRYRLLQPNLLGQIGMLCSQVLYGTDHLQEAVMKDFERRYGKDRQNAGFLILALKPPADDAAGLQDSEVQLDFAVAQLDDEQAVGIDRHTHTEESDESESELHGPSVSSFGKPSEADIRHWPPQPRVVGCVGVEIHPLLPNGARPPVFRRDPHDPTRTTWDRVRHRPLLSNLAVDPSCRRQRIGSRLVKACEEEVVKMGFEELLLKVEHCNDVAVDLYASLGYEGCPGGQMWEDKFVASGTGGGWEKTVNVALRKPLERPPRQVDARSGDA